MTDRRNAVAGLILTVAVVLGLAACASEEAETTFEVVLGEVGDLVAPLPVTLIDRTGLVTGVLSEVPIGFDRGDDGVANIPDHPDLLVVSWTGGMCDIEVAMLFERTAGHQIAEHTEAGQGGCFLAAIGRSVVIQLRSPVGAETVTFTVID
ncbi:MAG: hypothetical protein L0227_09695 [Chloroflexi bacterium]|nr:hypothetical protein [Chloroflexota bacterium]